MNTELDLRARNAMNELAGEFEDVLQEKKAVVGPSTTEGPDFSGAGIGGEALR